MKTTNLSNETPESCSNYKNQLAVTKFNALNNDEKKTVDDFCGALLGHTFTELVREHASKNIEPLTRHINIIWTVGDVQEVRPDLTDEEASHILDLLYSEHDANLGINWEIIESVAHEEYPNG